MSSKSGSIQVPLIQRDLDGARAAFTTRDPAASAVAHGTKAAATAHRAEPHVQGGEYVKLLVFGGLDGILTSFAIVAGAAGVGLSVKAVLGIGISNVLADALAMAVGEYLSTKSEKEYILEERSREAWEFQNFPEGECAEMVEIFVSRGMSQADAEDVIHKMARYPLFFVNLSAPLVSVARAASVPSRPRCAHLPEPAVLTLACASLPPSPRAQ